MKKAKRRNMVSLGIAEQVNIETGESVPIEGAHIRMFPPAPGLCQDCATDHPPHLPHNQQSLYYQMAFNAQFGRYPTWTDAMSHCTEEMKQFWREKLVALLVEKGLAIPEDLKEPS